MASTRDMALSQPRSLWALAFRKSAGKKMPTDDVLDILYWFRQVIGLVVGLALGIAKVQGMVGFVIYLLFVQCVPLWYTHNYLGVDEDLHGGMWKLLGEGFMPACGFFVLAWTMSFSLMVR